MSSSLDYTPAHLKTVTDEHLDWLMEEAAELEYLGRGPRYKAARTEWDRRQTLGANADSSFAPK